MKKSTKQLLMQIGSAFAVSSITGFMWVRDYIFGAIMFFIGAFVYFIGSDLFP